MKICVLKSSLFLLIFILMIFVNKIEVMGIDSNFNYNANAFVNSIEEFENLKSSVETEKNIKVEIEEKFKSFILKKTNEKNLRKYFYIIIHKLMETEIPKGKNKAEICISLGEQEFKLKIKKINNYFRVKYV
ncbi:MAG: hypothetical protein CfP315_0643 [Candidatus Improbicoccus pseudotrichonymphae]|uniref:Uncharacterized protein n=1 Tax=Candidatus Improbicoccus pseudotrichonymphae TaxID=3033792 RepID=A0AA48KVL9_9FIRM|nr:MAG: hypothetical protein CfP315_0643 [Candidatus Improbicoccus pseudotrichonymphae]